MKKLLTVLTLIAFTGSVFAATSFTTKLNNGLNSLSQKEQALNSKIDNAQAKRAAQKEEAKKQQEAQKKALEAKKAEVKQTQTNAKNEVNTAKSDAKKAVENEKSFWKNLFNFK